MNVTAIQPASAAALRSLSAPAAASMPQQESFTRSTTGEKMKQWAVIGGIGLAGAALGVYAGLSTGILPGLAGAVAGASGGALLGTRLPGENLKLGALAGVIGGAIVGASVAHPVAAVVLGIAGATVPVGLLLAVFSGVE